MDRNDLIYTILKNLTTLVGKIPLEQGSRLGATVGRWLYRLDPKHRAIAVDNLEHALGIKRTQAEATALRVFENLGKIFFEAAWLWTQPHEVIAPHFRIEGIANLEKISIKGHGILILTAHFGNWELLTYIAHLLGYPLNLIYRPLDFKPLDQLITSNRGRFGARPIPNKRSIRPILRALKQEQPVAFLMDQSCDWYDGVVTPFFHQLVYTSKGMALLALKSKAPVVPVFLVREGTQFAVHILPELTLVDSGDKIGDMETNSARFAAVIESFIRQYPDQWFWVHRRWKHKMSCPWPRKS